MRGEEVERVIRRLGYTKADLAHELGVSKRTVERWVTGGAGGASGFLLALIDRLAADHKPWRPNEVAVSISDDGKIEMEV
jgi:DNA-binding transcriptional regulator YiaG